MATPGSRGDISLSMTRNKGLQFTDVCVDVPGRRILWSVSGHALPGRVLAVMGPTGSGKTSLLNAVSGFGKVSSGSVTLNGQHMNGGVWHGVSYVMQNDVFFPNLTLKETLTYSALLRLPRELSFKEKLSRVARVLDQLQLSGCANTYVGSFLERGLSGGERKRTNIAVELLTEPVLLLLDEPTTGLDSSNALIVMKILGDLAKQGKIIVLTIHQPSSKLFHMFDELMLLAKGKVAYFGEASQALNHFAHVGLHCTAQYNPADYMLEMVANSESRRALIGTDPEEHVIQDAKRRPWWSRWFHTVLGICCGVARDGTEKHLKSAKTDAESAPLLESSNQELPSFPPYDSVKLDRAPSSLSSSSHIQPGHIVRKWPTPWYWQFLVLVVRTFRRARRNILSKLRLIQSLFLAVICGLIWFQVPHEEHSIFDRYSFLFFLIAYWSIDATTSATLSLPLDNEVVSKERASRSYYLSAYYMAKFVTELPPVLVDPSIFLIITFWAGGIGGPVAFFGVWAVLIVNSFAAQAMGVMLGCILMDLRSGLVAAQVISLAFILVGGFYVKHFPFWLKWIPYVSFISYSFHGMLQFTFTDHVHFSCGQNSTYEACNVTDVSNATIPGGAVLDELHVTIPLYMNFVALFAFGIGFRILGYFALRILHRPQQ